MSRQRARLITLGGLCAFALTITVSDQLLTEGHWYGWLGIPAAVAIISVTAYELLRRRDDPA